MDWCRQHLLESFSFSQAREIRLSWGREIDAVIIGCNEMFVTRQAMGEHQGWACQGDNKCHPMAVYSPGSLETACWYEIGVEMRFYCSTPGCDGALG